MMSHDLHQRQDMFTTRQRALTQRKSHKHSIDRLHENLRHDHQRRYNLPVYQHSVRIIAAFV